MRLTLLGTGTSFGVPQIGCECGVCRSSDPKDRRTRTAALLESEDTAILIDTPPELRLQLLAAGTRRLDAVLYTHEHADHVGGIDDLRIFSVRRPEPLPLYGAPPVLEFLRSSYRYIFDDATPVYAGTSRPRLTLRTLEASRPLDIAGVPVLPIQFEHGHEGVMGFRFGAVAYLTDVKRVPDEAREQLRNLEILVLNALWWRPHPTHLSIPEAIDTARALGARRTVLTHLTHETGHADLASRLPPGVEPGYDGLSLEVSG
ncbi:MAG: MBL fold metallo-hydrolase [Gemmatimonadales bacterium]